MVIVNKYRALLACLHPLKSLGNSSTGTKLTLEVLVLHVELKCVYVIFQSHFIRLTRTLQGW